MPPQSTILVSFVTDSLLGFMVIMQCSVFTDSVPLDFDGSITGISPPPMVNGTVTEKPLPKEFWSEAVERATMSAVDLSSAISFWTSLICDCSASVFHCGTYSVLTTASTVNMMLSSSIAAITVAPADSELKRLFLAFSLLLFVLVFIAGHRVIFLIKYFLLRHYFLNPVFEILSGKIHYFICKVMVVQKLSCKRSA
ncbi:hypothetical protein MSLAZ_0109 [Methanosarcina lacustris Z-7289]|uniref:Uncharacterized protein n=1 Tax=Methanosarcina lacustris Z-7289 TaxID=1434111 RepID=A0A0E3WQS0_9EURY|nr:hypothetical protein MSLAZ_0109 [Methanosarcina lacustris Z-7289]